MPTISRHHDHHHPGLSTLDPEMLTYHACSECCLPQTWCRCEEGTGDA
jgi:hypothetical protein